MFGFMGMALGAALTYQPAERKAINTSFSIDSDIKRIDDRSVILNFYSEMKKQYIDIELPQDIYNFLQTDLAEKKYGIVVELEKKTVVRQSTDIVENGQLLKVEKLKMMRDAGLLSDEKFAEEQAKLLSMV